MRSSGGQRLYSMLRIVNFILQSARNSNLFGDAQRPKGGSEMQNHTHSLATRRLKTRKRTTNLRKKKKEISFVSCVCAQPKSHATARKTSTGDEVIGAQHQHHHVGIVLQAIAVLPTSHQSIVAFASVNEPDLSHDLRCNLLLQGLLVVASIRHSSCDGNLPRNRR